MPGPATTEEAQPPRLLIGVPTCHRPRMLARCLESLLQLEQPAALRVEVLVVDNDPRGSARAVVEACAGGRVLHYVVEPQRGLSSVRNRILNESRRLGATWLAGIDDDEFALRGWLVALWEAQQRHGADVVCGPVLRVVWGGTIKPAAIQAAGAAHPEGHVPRRVASGNALLRLDALGVPPLDFDARLDLSGGEDHDFFERLRARGARFAWAAQAAVVEWIPPERQGIRYPLARHFSDGVSAVVRARYSRPAWRVWLHYGVKALGKLGGAVLALLGLPFGPRRALMGAAVRVSNALGCLAGLLGARAERYRRTDGF